ncbi:MAG: ABC transporter permease subunit [Ruthenibacterium sp.]
MIRLIQNELKKIVFRPLFLVLLGVLMSFVLFIGLISPIFDTTYFAWKERYRNPELSSQSEWVTGIDAIRLNKEYTKAYEGIWTDAKLTNYATELQTAILEGENYTKSIAQFGPVEYLLQKAFNPDNSIKTLGEMFPSLGEPLYFGWAEGFCKAVENSNLFLGFFITLLVIVGVAPVFCDEYQYKTDALLYSAKLGKTQMLLAKIVSVFIFTVGITLLMYLMQFVFSGIVFGFSGWSQFIQMTNQYCYYMHYMTFGQLTVAMIGIMLIAETLIACFTMVSSVLCRNAFSTLAVAGGIFLVGILPNMLIDVHAEKWIEFLPIDMVTPLRFFDTYEVYDIAGLSIPQIPAIIFIVSLLSIICCIAVIIFYKRHEVK